MMLGQWSRSGALELGQFKKALDTAFMHYDIPNTKMYIPESKLGMFAADFFMWWQ